MRSYEGLFILNTAAKEEGVKEIIDRLTRAIESLGGKVETVQKMDKREFARVSSKKVSSGFYVNILFQLAPEGIAKLHAMFERDEEMYRAMFTQFRPRTETTPTEPVAT